MKTSNCVKIDSLVNRNGILCAVDIQKSDYWKFVRFRLGDVTFKFSMPHYDPICYYEDQKYFDWKSELNVFYEYYDNFEIVDNIDPRFCELVNIYDKLPLNIVGNYDYMNSNVIDAQENCLYFINSFGKLLLKIGFEQDGGMWMPVCNWYPERLTSRESWIDKLNQVTIGNDVFKLQDQSVVVSSIN